MISTNCVWYKQGPLEVRPLDVLGMFLAPLELEAVPLDVLGMHLDAVLAPLELEAFPYPLYVLGMLLDAGHKF